MVYALAYLARWVAYFGLYVAIVNTARDDDVEPLWRTLERMVLAFAIFGLFQAVFLPGFAQLVYPETGESMPWDHQYHRLVSTLLDPNFAGMLVLLPLFVQLGRIAYGAPVARWKPLVLIAATFATFSRSSVLALVIGGLVILSVVGLRRRLVRLVGVVAVLTAPFLPVLVAVGIRYAKFRIDDSALARTVNWLRALTVFADHPVLGVGFNTYGFVQRRYGWQIMYRDAFGLDGGLLFIAVLTGLVGLAVYVTMLALVARRARRLWRDPGASPEARGTALGVAAAIPALVVHSCFSASLVLPFIMEPLWVLFGLVFLYARGRRAERLAAGVGSVPLALPVGAG
jgi:O-antigen ligase